MNLRIIKKGVVKNLAVQPFFFTEENAESRPEPYVLPEIASTGNVFPSHESSEAAGDNPSSQVINIEQLKKDTFDRGYAEGREEGLQEGLKEGLKTGEETAAARIEEMTRLYTDALAEVATFKNTLRAQVEEEVVRLALAVAKKIVHREIHIDPTIIHTLVRVALERVSGKSTITIRLSPVDYEYMMHAHGNIAREEGREIHFESDGVVTQGSCLIQTENGDIDARIEEEFHEVESAFFEGL